MHSAPNVSRRILIAEPDEDARSLYRTILVPTGADVVETIDGRAALTDALVRPPTLLIAELHLPFIDGYALCDILRKDRTTREVPILVVTRETRELHRARQVADAVLAKPVAPKALFEHTQRLLAQSQAVRQRCDDAAVVAESELSRAATLLASSDQLRLTKRSSRMLRFVTTSPPASPPQLVCPTCDRPLAHECSFVGGVNDKNAEQWDYFACSTCQTHWQYRQRTGKVRVLAKAERDLMRPRQK
jgi:DNA-binding response OmpR family regulator